MDQIKAITMPTVPLVDNAAASQATVGAHGTGFMNSLQQAISKANDLQLEASQATEALMTGQTEHARVEQTPREESLRNEIVLRSRGLHVWPRSGPTDFELYRGEIVGVAGLDGQGQSEFVRILAGIDAPDAVRAVGAANGRNPLSIIAR